MNLLCFIDETNVIVILEDMINKYNNFNTSESKSDHKRDFSFTILSNKVIKRKKNMNKRIWHYNHQLALVDPFDHQKEVMELFHCGEPLSSQDLNSNSPDCWLG